MRSKWGRRYASLTESILSSQGFVYTFVALYMITNILLFLGEAVEESYRHDDFQKYTTAIARGCGTTLNFNMAVVLLLASRSALSVLRETPLNMVLPIDKAMPDLHRVAGILVVIAGLLHSVLHWVTYGIKHPWSSGYNGFTSLFSTGMLLLLVIIVIRIAARSAVYHANYEVFFRLHVGGSVLAFILLVLHGNRLGVPSSWKWVVGPIAIYVLDVAFRSFREKRSYLLVSKHSAVFQGPDIVKVRLPRVFHFQAGQYAELKVPRLSRFQWHPFTIASAPHEPEMVFYIKTVGNWTSSLYDLFGERINAEDPEDIEVHIRGPFGAPAQHVGQFDRVILVGGGVGSTPFCSVAKDAYHWITNWMPRKTKRKGKSANQRALRGNPHRMTGAEDDRNGSSSEIAIRGRIPLNEIHASAEDRAYSSHLFTTNIFSENLESLGVLDDIRRLEDLEVARPSRRDGKTRSKAVARLPYEHEAGDKSSIGWSSMYTARDYLVPMESSSSDSTNSLPQRSSDSRRQVSSDIHDVIEHVGTRVITESLASEEIRRLENRTFIQKLSGRMARGSQRGPNDGMGSYHENSTGTYRRSLDYMSALHSAYSEREQDEIFQQSLDLMVGLSFGSVSLVRNMQVRRAQRSMKQAAGERLPVSIDKEDLSMFQNPRIMFLLFMRSVTVNMVILWILLVRFVMAGGAHIFGALLVFEQGIALYNNPALLALDLVLALAITVLVGTPSVIEMIELGAAPVHGFDLFVLTPASFFGVVVDIIALAGVGKSVNMFTVLHVFVIWPVLTVLVMIRLLRVVGERIAQAENLTTTHSTTRKVDFFWTAPTPEDDRWLVDELTPYADVETVQMHRFLTRCEEPTKQHSRTISKRPNSMHTNFGRPNWLEILNETAESCPNNTTIGVFFCGPPSMGIELQEACMSAMRNSIVRGLHAGARAMRGLEEVFGEAISANEYTGEVSKSSRAGSRGCNVKIVFKRESFS